MMRFWKWRQLRRIGILRKLRRTKELCATIQKSWLSCLDRNAGFWNEHPEARRGLEEQNESGKPLAEIERELLAFCDEHFAGETKILLAGNSIHQDRRFIDQWWPTLSKKLHYRVLDVSAWKVVFEGKYGKKFAKPEDHRALEDIRGSIMELEYY